MRRGRASIEVPAPAKINLFLHVTGRRADGYHTLESLFAPVDLADTIVLSLRDDGRVERASDVPGVDEPNDLTLRAAHALRQESATNLGVTIDLRKRIPIGAGLGGGSSDAASVLIGLNCLWNLRWPRTRLTAIGARLGADVPFFLGDGPAIVRGVGEELTPASMPTAWIALAMPGVQVATSTIFAAPELTRATPSAKMNVFSEGYGRNDLEAVASARFPDVKRAIDALKRASPLARMTGSGACAFAAFRTEQEARDAVANLPPGCEGRVLHTLARHPLAALN
jgi:4-diphosphocytidyl-2-C-methyl-D-erythritol kinase